MTLPRDVHASRQGQHDYLCGIYSLINTLSYLYDGRVRREKLMYRLLSSYKRRWDLFDLLTLGLDEEQMDHLIADVLLRGCGVVINSGRSSCSLVEPASLVWRGVW